MVKKCTICDDNNKDDANFCSKCGTSFTVQTPQVASTPPVTVKQMPSVGVVHPGVQAYHRVTPARVPSPGMCHYHPSIPAVYICNRCGRPICQDDAKMYGGLIVCPQCYRAFPAGYVVPMPIPTYYALPTASWPVHPLPMAHY